MATVDSINVNKSDIVLQNMMKGLVNNLGFSRLAHNWAQNNFEGKIGDTIGLETPFETLIGEGRQVVYQPLVDKKTNLTIDKHNHWASAVNAIDTTFLIDNYQNRYVNRAMKTLANTIDTNVMKKIYWKIDNVIQPGVTGIPINYDDQDDTASFMDEMGIETDRRILVASPTTCRKMSRSLTRDNLNDEMLIRSAVVDQYKGMYGGFKTHATQNLPKHTVGAYTYSGSNAFASVDGADQGGTVLITDGWGSGAKLNRGDTIYIDGIYRTNPMNKESVNYQASFAVAETATANGSGEMTIKLTRDINDGLQTVPDESDGAASDAIISTAAYQNVSKSIPDNAQIKVTGDAGVTYRINMHFDPEGMAFQTIKFKTAAGGMFHKYTQHGNSHFVSDFGGSGASIMITFGYTFASLIEAIRVDVLYGADMVYEPHMYRSYGEVIK